MKKMSYCCVEEIFEGIFETREDTYKALKNRFETIEWAKIVDINKDAFNNEEYGDDDVPIIDIITIEWDNGERANYEIITCEVNRVYSA